MKTTTLSLAFLFLLTVNTFAQHGVTSPWQPTAVQLPKANPTYAAYTTVGHTMVVDKLGKIYVFYREYDLSNPNSERLYINTSTDGINWTPSIFPPAQNFKPGYYNVAIDTANNIHVVWVKSTTGQLHYSKYDYNLSQWAIDTVISDTINDVIRGTAVTVDRKMRVHVSWIDGQDTSVNAEIMYRRSPDNGTSWDNQQNISNTPGFPSCWQQGDFTGTFSDTLAYAWRENVNPSGSDNWDIMLAFTTDGGVNWQSRICSTASGTGQQRDPVAAVLKDNSVIISYEKWPVSFGDYKKIYAGKSNNIVTTDPSFTQISDTVYSELLIDGYDYNNDLYYTFWKWRYASEAAGHMDIGGRFWDNTTLQWSNTNSAGGYVEWCTDIGSSELGFKKCAIGPDGKVHLLYGMPPTGMASLYYTYRVSPLTGISPLDFSSINTIIYPNPFSTQTILQTTEQLTNATLTVDNCFGQTVAEIKNISGQTITFSRDNLASGLYFVHLTQDNKVITTKKIIIAD